MLPFASWKKTRVPACYKLSFCQKEKTEAELTGKSFIADIAVGAKANTARVRSRI